MLFSRYRHWPRTTTISKLMFSKYHYSRSRVLTVLLILRYFAFRIRCHHCTTYIKIPNDLKYRHCLSTTTVYILLFSKYHYSRGRAITVLLLSRYFDFKVRYDHCTTFIQIPHNLYVPPLSQSTTLSILILSFVVCCICYKRTFTFLGVKPDKMCAITFKN